MGFYLWELILLVVILKIMISSQTLFCDENNIDRNDCDYNTIGSKHFCLTIGYLIGKIFFTNY